MSVKIDSKNFGEYINGGKLVVVDFYADWCAPCRAMSPIIDELSEHFGERVIVGKLDVEADSSIADSYGVKSIPTLIFFKDGEVVDKTSGSVSKIQLEDMINSHI